MQTGMREQLCPLCDRAAGLCQAEWFDTMKGLGFLVAAKGASYTFCILGSM